MRFTEDSITLSSMTLSGPSAGVHSTDIGDRVVGDTMIGGQAKGGRLTNGECRPKNSGYGLMHGPCGLTVARVSWREAHVARRTAEVG